MNKQLQRLYEIAQKEQRIILGLMSGTSLDGLDVACCSISGTGNKTRVDLLHFETVAYSHNFRKIISDIAFTDDTRLSDVSWFHKKIAKEHSSIVLQLLQSWSLPPSVIDLIASHGQTIYHAPCDDKLDAVGHHSFQAGDGDHIAQQTGIITLCDFRQKHLAAGGEGAPLAVYGDYLLYGNREQDSILLNIGGISNFTYLAAGASFDKVISTDAGPGNTLMNKWCEWQFGQSFDNEGAIAAEGKTDFNLLEIMKKHPFLQKELPASTGPENFSMQWLQECLNEAGQSINSKDVMATLNKYTASCIVQSIEKCIDTNKKISILVSGGGLHNKTLMNELKIQFSNSQTEINIQTAEHSDAKEAIIFALLANEAVAGNPSDSFGSGNINSPSISFGKICLPG
jgi:anhydro-N-acetylmuramic acid kinase